MVLFRSSIQALDCYILLYSHSVFLIVQEWQTNVRCGRESLCMCKALVGLDVLWFLRMILENDLLNSTANECSKWWITCLTSPVNLLRLLRDCFIANHKVFPHYVPTSGWKLSPIQEFIELSGKSVYLEQQGHTKFRVHFTLKYFFLTTR